MECSYQLCLLQAAFLEPVSHSLLRAFRNTDIICELQPQKYFMVFKVNFVPKNLLEINNIIKNNNQSNLPHKSVNNSTVGHQQSVVPFQAFLK